jgi:hypothetical protein
MTDDQMIPLGNIENWEELLHMTDAEARAHLETALETMTFEEQAEFLRRLGGEE